MPAMSQPTGDHTRLPTIDRDWPVQAADGIVDLVDTVREKTTARAVIGARGVVFGLVIAVLATIAGVSLLVGVVRVTQVAIVNIGDMVGREVPHSRAVWISYLLVGAVFTVLGTVLWRMANRRASSPEPVEVEEPA